MLDVATVGIHDEDLVICVKDDSLPIWRPRRPGIGLVVVREPLDVRPIGIYHVDLEVPIAI